MERTESRPNGSTHTISLLVENKPGVLHRIAGLFSRRGYNIASLTVGPTERPEYSRMTIVVRLSSKPVEQVVRQAIRRRDGVGGIARITVRGHQALAQDRIPPQEAVGQTQRPERGLSGQPARDERHAQKGRDGHGPVDPLVLREPRR